MHCNVNLVITYKSDCESILKDLDTLDIWKHTCQRAFHPGKRNFKSISRNKNPYIYRYTLHGHILEHFDKAKHLS